MMFSCDEEVRGLTPVPLMTPSDVFQIKGVGPLTHQDIERLHLQPGEAKKRRD
jgi:hypothetical protein